MTLAREESEWAQTSTIWALFANAFRDKDRKPTPFMPSDINPYAKRARRPKTKAQLRAELREFYERAVRRTGRAAKKKITN